MSEVVGQSFKSLKVKFSWWGEGESYPWLELRDVAGEDGPATHPTEPDVIPG